MFEPEYSGFFLTKSSKHFSKRFEFEIILNQHHKLLIIMNKKRFVVSKMFDENKKRKISKTLERNHRGNDTKWLQSHLEIAPRTLRSVLLFNDNLVGRMDSYRIPSARKSSFMIEVDSPTLNRKNECSLPSEDFDFIFSKSCESLRDCFECSIMDLFDRNNLSIYNRSSPLLSILAEPYLACCSRNALVLQDCSGTHSDREKKYHKKLKISNHFEKISRSAPSSNGCRCRFCSSSLRIDYCNLRKNSSLKCYYDCSNFHRWPQSFFKRSSFRYSQIHNPRNLFWMNETNSNGSTTQSNCQLCCCLECAINNRFIIVDL